MPGISFVVAVAEREAWLDVVTNDPLLSGWILPSDYLGQQARWPPAKAGGGWMCCATPAGNCLSRRSQTKADARSTPNKPEQAARDAGQAFVAYAT